MKTILLILALCVAVPMQSGCATRPPSARTTEVTTLKILGASRDTAMKVAGQMWRDGQITNAQRDAIIAFHDEKFQRAYNLAVLAVRSNLDSFAGPELLALFAELQSLIPRKP